MLEEDYEEESFFVAVRRGYWQAGESSPARRIGQALIEKGKPESENREIRRLEKSISSKKSFMEHMTYEGSGVDYGALDPFKRRAQLAGRSTADVIRRLGVSEVR